MKGVILAGGKGSRLRPLTNFTNKHLLPIYNKPMIYYPIKILIDMGIKEILIISDPEYVNHFFKLLSSEKKFNVKFSYVSKKETGGIGKVLGLAKDFADKDSIAVVLGDNIFEEKFNISNYDEGAMIFLKEVDDPERFGVAEVKKDKVISIEEKPLKPKSNLAVTGLYIYDKNVFDYIKKLNNKRKIEITDINNIYLKKGKLKANFVKGYWVDAGTFESLFKANNLVKKKNKK